MKTRTTYCDRCEQIASHWVYVDCHPEQDGLCVAETICFACGHNEPIDEHENAFDADRRMAELRWPDSKLRQRIHHGLRRAAQWEAIGEMTQVRIDAIRFNAYMEDSRELNPGEEDEIERMREIGTYAVMRAAGHRACGCGKQRREGRVLCEACESRRAFELSCDRAF